MPSGPSNQKRSWDTNGTSGSSNGYPHKRARDDDSRDWKDVHLKGDSRSSGRRGSERDRLRESEKDRDAYRQDSRRGGQRWHDGERDRDRRERGDRNNSGSARHERERDSSRRSPRPLSHSRSRSNHARDQKDAASVNDSEREEGE